MMEISKLALTKKIRNVLLISNSADNAERLLLPFMANFEENQRIIQDYGQQKKPGAWETGEFTCMSGCSFRAIGAGQSPRGTRNKNFRPDFILVDDIDTDEECRNPERIKTKWKWLEEALIPTMSVSGNYRILFNGNIIAPDCCIKRAIEKATELKAKGIGHVDIINIRGKDGLSVWPEKELRGGYRPLPLTGQRGGGTERVLQQPGGGRRRVRGNHLRESAGTFQVQVPGDIRGPRTGREQDEKKFHQNGVPARETRGKALSDKNVPGQGAERGICRVVHQAAGVRGRENHRILLHGEQQITGSFFSSRYSSPSCGGYAGKGKYHCTSPGTRRRRPTRPHVSRRTWNRSTGRGTWYSTRPKRTTRT